MDRKKDSGVNNGDIPCQPHSISPLSQVTAEAEKDYILKILKSTNGNRSAAAQLLGISRKTLWEKLKIYGIES